MIFCSNCFPVVMVVISSLMLILSPMTSAVRAMMLLRSPPLLFAILMTREKFSMSLFPVRCAKLSHAFSRGIFMLT